MRGGQGLLYLSIKRKWFVFSTLPPINIKMAIIQKIKKHWKWIALIVFIFFLYSWNMQSLITLIMLGVIIFHVGKSIFKHINSEFTGQ